MVSKLLIAAGTSHYDFLTEDLQRPQLEEVVRSVVDLFTGKLGYTRVLEEIGSNPTSESLVGRLDDWFASPNLKPSDWVVVYYTGHGELDGDNLVLLTRDSKDGRAASTGVSAERLGQVLMSRAAGGEKRRIKNCFLILDTCHSGAGAFDLIGKLRKFFDEGDPGRFYLLASSLPREEAMAGALARAIIDSINDESLGGSFQPFLFFDQLEPAINERLQPHRAFGVGLGSSPERSQFLPNPRFKAGLTSGATVAEVRRAVQKDELHTFWGPVSRGLALEEEPGWFFTGRRRALTELSAWLQDKEDKRSRVVTGRAGSGKSAVLARIVTLSDPEYRSRMSPSDLPWTNLIPEGSIDIAIHAKGKTLNDFIRRLAANLAVEASESAIFAGLAARTVPYRILVDALDEAREPDLILQHLLSPLQLLPGVKLLVGTRPEFKNKLGPEAAVIPVDDPDYFERDDLSSYVETRLLSHVDPAGETLYRGKQELARALASAVAEKAYPNFLIARLVTEKLLSSDKTPDISDVAAMEFPATVDIAFEEFLSRFGSDGGRARALLSPLAWAEGLGLPWGNIWPAAASELSPVRYTDQDVQWLMEHAGSFVVEMLEGERSVYRLYHQALADHLRKGRSASAVQRSMTTALLSSVPVGAAGVYEWSKAHPYILVHLAEHAAAAGMLPDLLADPGFLLHADSTRLLGAIRTSTVALPVPLVRTYKAFSIHGRSKPVQGAAAYLELIARENGLDWDLSKLVATPWRALWADWLPSPPNTVIAVGDEEISVLEIGEWNFQQAVALVGRENGAVEVWDIATNVLINEWSGNGRVRRLGLAHPETGHVVIAAHESVLAVYDQSSRESKSVETGKGKEDAITGLTVLFHKGKWLCATANNNLRLALWNIPDLNLRKETSRATAGSIYNLTPALYRGQQVLASGGDSLQRYVEKYDDSILHLWSLDDLTLLWEDGRKTRNGYVEQLQTGRFFDLDLMVATGIACGQIWNANESELLYEEPDWSGRWFLYQRGAQVARLAERGGKVEVAQATMQSEPRAIVLDAPTHVFSVEGAVAGIARSQGRDVLLSKGWKSVRVWDIEELLLGPSTYQDLPRFRGLALIPEQAVCMIFGYDFIVKDLRNGAEISRRPISLQGDPEVPVDIAYCQELDCVILATYSGKILRADAALLTELKLMIDLQTKLEKLRLIRWGKRMVVLVTCGERTWATRAFDLESGEEVLSDRHFGLRGGQEDKRLLALAVTRLASDKIRFAFAGQYGKVMVADFEGRHNFTEWYMFDRGGYTRCLEAGREDGTELLVAGTEQGRLLVWDFEDGEVLAKNAQAHAAGINSLSIFEGPGKSYILSGGDDGFLRIWDTSLNMLAEVEVSEAVSAVMWLDDKRIVAGTSRGVIAIEFATESWHGQSGAAVP